MELTKEEFLSKIPDDWIELKNFLKKRTEDYYFDLIEDQFGLRMDEVSIGKRQYLIQIDTDRGFVEFIDDLVDLEQTSYIRDNVDFDEWKLVYNKLEEDIKKLGFDLMNSGNGGNEDYIWYLIKCSVHDFTEENLIKASQLWSKFNEDRREKYNFN